MESPWEKLRKLVLPTAVIRAIDARAVQEFGVSSLVLMENAATNCVWWLRERYPRPPRTVVLCGPGNNGGDGLVIARHLRTFGWDCQCFIAGPADKFSSDAHANWRILNAHGGAGIQVVQDPQSESALQAAIASAELIIDAMLGTGAKGNPRAPLAGWIAAANAAAADRVAIDIPSGVQADQLQVADPWFRAAATLTFVARKPAMAHPDAHKYFGEIEVLPIGIPEQLILELLGAHALQ